MRPAPRPQPSVGKHGMVQQRCGRALQAPDGASNDAQAQAARDSGLPVQAGTCTAQLEAALAGRAANRRARRAVRNGALVMSGCSLSRADVPDKVRCVSAVPKKLGCRHHVKAGVRDLLLALETPKPCDAPQEGNSHAHAYSYWWWS